MPEVPNLIYMFEFLIDDLVITQKNYCAPEEYPVYVEIVFRNSVYVNICDREYGEQIDPYRNQTGKRCIFALESPVKKDDKLLIYVYKKRNDCCKFLIGLMEMKIKFLFDRVKKAFDKGNPNWSDYRQNQLSDMPQMKDPKSSEMDRCDCFKSAFDSGYERREQLTPYSELSKQMLPIFNLCKRQTGNIVLLMRLSCHGPTIVSAFWQQGKCYVPQPPSKQPQNSPSYLEIEEFEGKPLTKCFRFFACNRDKLCPCDECEDDIDRKAALRKRKSTKKQNKAKKSCNCKPTSRSTVPKFDGVEQREVEDKGDCDQIDLKCEPLQRRWSSPLYFN